FKRNAIDIACRLAADPTAVGVARDPHRVPLYRIAIPASRDGAENDLLLWGDGAHVEARQRMLGAFRVRLCVHGRAAALAPERTARRIDIAIAAVGGRDLPGKGTIAALHGRSAVPFAHAGRIGGDLPLLDKQGVC